MLLLPEFRENYHYRELSSDKENRKYRFILLKPLEIDIKEIRVPPNITLSFRDTQNREWLQLQHQHILIPKNYAWNGASPKRYIEPFKWVGPPDYEKTRMATVVHDSLCQFLNADYFPPKRWELDIIFKNILESTDFGLSQIYYMGACLGTKLNFLQKSNNGKTAIIVNT